jgi:hypothetical protein
MPAAVLDVNVNPTPIRDLELKGTYEHLGSTDEDPTDYAVTFPGTTPETVPRNSTSQAGSQTSTAPAGSRPHSGSTRSPQQFQADLPNECS